MIGPYKDGVQVATTYTSFWLDSEEVIINFIVNILDAYFEHLVSFKRVDSFSAKTKVVSLLKKIANKIGEP